MHRCFYVDEILRIIVRNISGSETLFHLALTCKSLHWPAVEVLWEDLPGMRPLLALLPGDAYKIPQEYSRGLGGEPEIPGRLMITRIPRKEEWDRVQRFSRFVRRLMLPPSDAEKPHAVSYNTLCIVRDRYSGTSLFPRLRRLIIENWDISPLYGLFLSPPLQSLTFIPSIEEMSLELSKALDAHPCNLEELIVGSGSGYGIELPTIVDALSRFLLRQTRLRRLSIPTHISGPAMKHLACSPSLSFLELDFIGGLYDGMLPRSSTNFSGLKSLCLRAAWFNPDVASLSEFLDAFARHSCLRELTLDFTASSSDPLSKFFAVLSQFTSLTHLRLEFKARSRRWDGPPIPVGVLEPLYRTDAMSHLDLSQLPMSVAPDDIRKMAAAWPNIFTVKLGQSRRKPVPTLTLEDTVPFAEFCPYLCSFGVKLRPEPKLGWVAPSPRHQHGFMMVDVGQSGFQLQDAPHIAAICAELFPSGTLFVGPSLVGPIAGTRETVDQINKLKSQILRAE